MIPQAHIVAWRQFAPWVSDAQVEQDLIISRALVAIFEYDILAKQLEEMLATKVRAFYQRRKGCDLFDLWLGLTDGKADAATIVEIFKKYMKAEGNKVGSKHYAIRSEASDQGG